MERYPAPKVFFFYSVCNIQVFDRGPHHRARALESRLAMNVLVVFGKYELIIKIMVFREGNDRPDILNILKMEDNLWLQT